MKKIRNNLWNKIFHSKALKEYQEWKEKAHAIIGWNKQLNEGLMRASSLQELINIHKHAWEIGYRNRNIAPCPWGMFRCESIPELTLDTLYLGNIWGLWTNNGTFWEDHKDETMAGNGFGINPDKKCYDLIMQQYRSHLRSNINAIADNTAKELINNKSLHRARKKYTASRRASHDLLKYLFGGRMKSRYKYACTDKTGELIFGKQLFTKESLKSVSISTFGLHLKYFTREYRY